MGGVMTTLIPRNTTIPTSKKEVFSTAADNQPAVDIHVLQGERPMAADNKTLGNFQLSGIPAARRGVPQIEVTFDIDANGIVNVTAKDLGTNKSQKITITSNTNLSDEEVEEMMKEAEANKEKDKKRKEEADLRNDAEQLCFQTEDSMKDFKDKVDSKEKEEIEELIKEVREELTKDELNIEELTKKKDKLQEKAIEIASKVYQQASPEENATSEENSEDKKDENIKDADYEEK